jgi:asparagine synthase (glutamine-hydrolysing)
VIAGWFDWRGPHPGAPAPRVRLGDDGRSRIAGPGVSATIGGDADVAIRGAWVAIARGDVPAARWIDLLATEGEHAAASAHGRYALVAFDMQRRRAVLAVDRFNVLPLCWAAQGSRLAFADRADALPLLDDPDLDAQALFDYLYFHVIPAPRTIHRGVSRLDAACTLAFDGEGARLERHWQPAFDESRRATLADLATEFRARVESAVAAAAGERAGCFLSGGTDSSTIAGMLTRVTGRPARTFSIGFDAAGYDEMAYARIAARHFRTEHHEHYVTPEELVDAIPLVAAHFDQPFGNSSAVPAFLCARLARATGVDTLLGGDGGDELFGGNTRYAKQRLFAAYGRVPRVLRAGLIEPVLCGLPGVARLPGLRKPASYVQQARVPMPERMQTYNLLTRLGPDNVLHPEFLARVTPQTAERQMRGTYDACEAASLVNRMLAYDWKYTLADNDLPKVRESAAAAGVAARFPLLDDAVVDLSLRLDPALKVRGLQLRWFFKHALRDFLPPEILAKKKHGFGLPFGPWLVAHRRLREFVEASLATLRGRGIVRDDFIDRLVGDVVGRHPGYYGEMVWVLMMLGQWLDTRAAAREPPANPADRYVHGTA